MGGRELQPELNLIYTPSVCLCVYVLHFILCLLSHTNTPIHTKPSVENGEKYNIKIFEVSVSTELGMSAAVELVY